MLYLSYELATEMVSLPHSLASSPNSNRLHDFPVTFPRSRYFKNIYVNSLLSHTERPIQCAIYSINNPVRLKLLTHLRLGLSHLNEHRFNHNFKNCINPLCSCSFEIELASHFLLLHCHHYTNICSTLLNSIVEIIGNIFNINDECLVNLLLFGNQKYTEINNSHIINSTIKYLLDSGRFSGPLL